MLPANIGIEIKHRLTQFEYVVEFPSSFDESDYFVYIVRNKRKAVKKHNSTAYVHEGFLLIYQSASLLTTELRQSYTIKATAT